MECGGQECLSHGVARQLQLFKAKQPVAPAEDKNAKKSQATGRVRARLLLALQLHLGSTLTSPGEGRGVFKMSSVGRLMRVTQPKMHSKDKTHAREKKQKKKQKKQQQQKECQYLVIKFMCRSAEKKQERPNPSKWSLGT